MNNFKAETLSIPHARYSKPAQMEQMPEEKKGNWFNLPFVLLSFSFIVFGILNFNVKLFLMGDDANYILDGYNFIHRHAYPEQSSLYGMIIGLIELFSGTDVVLLKCCSFLFAFTGFVTLYRIGYRRIAPHILYPVLIFSIINSNLQYYSSSNLSEAFFMMLQYLYTGYVFLFIDRYSKGGQGRVKYWLGLGFMGLLMSLGKNVAVVAPMAIVVYFLCARQWRNALKAFGVFLLFKVPYELLLRLVYHKNTAASQLDQVLAKELYHHEAGRETLAGFGLRFLKNIQIYLSQVTLKEFGLITGGLIGLVATLVMTALLVAAIWFARKGNKYVFFIGLYTAVMMGTTFFALQPAVAQDRIIIVFLPYLLLLLLFAEGPIMKRINGKHPAFNRKLYYGILLLIGLINFKITSVTIRNNLPVLQENISGDPYFGYTPDWINYLEMGKWVTEHVGKQEVVAARKPNGLSVYCNGRDFYGIYNFPTNLNADQLLDKLKGDKVSYMILASLRADKRIADPKNIITTLHKYGAKIIEKYPRSMKIIRTIGKEEPCYLVKIIYPEKKENKKVTSGLK
jgi:hypothetical protein